MNKLNKCDCGAILISEALFCEVCGNPVQERAGPLPPPLPPKAGAPPPKPSVSPRPPKPAVTALTKPLVKAPALPTDVAPPPRRQQRKHKILAAVFAA